VLSDQQEKLDPLALVVDDDPDFLTNTVEMLQSEGIRAVAVTSGKEAISLVEDGDYHLVITDLAMEDMTGIDLLSELKRKRKLVPVICVSSIKSFTDVLEMLRSGASDFLTKPLDREELLRAAWKAFYEFQEAEEKERIISQSENWTRELMALRQLGEASGREMLFNLFKKTIDAVSDTLQVETASLMVLEGDYLRLVEARGLPENIIGTATVPIGQGISGTVGKTGKPLLVNDISKHKKFRPSSFKEQYTTQSALCVPLTRGNRVLGVLNANNKISGDVFTESDLDLLVTMASQVAMSIDNAKLFQGLEDKARDLEKAHEEVVRLDRDKTELILNISHELKTPLSTIVGFSSLIPSIELSGDTETLYHYSKYLDLSATHLNHLVERMLELFRLEAGRYQWNFSYSPLMDSIGQANKGVEAGLAEREFLMNMDDIENTLVYCDMKFLARAIELVIENAIKFSSEGSRIMLEGSWSDDMPQIPDYAVGDSPPSPGSGASGWVLLIVSDEGEGMKENELPYIFEKFRQLGDIMTGKPQGIGLGLSIARSIMEYHGGAIWAESSPGGGSRLHLLMSGKRR